MIFAFCTVLPCTLCFRKNHVSTFGTRGFCWSKVLRPTQPCWLLQCELTVPAFTKGKHQLSAKDVEIVSTGLNLTLRLNCNALNLWSLPYCRCTAPKCQTVWRAFIFRSRSRALWYFLSKRHSGISVRSMQKVNPDVKINIPEKRPDLVKQHTATRCELSSWCLRERCVVMPSNQQCLRVLQPLWRISRTQKYGQWTPLLRA